MTVSFSRDIGLVILLALIWVAAVLAAAFIGGKSFAMSVLQLTATEAKSLAIKSGYVLVTITLLELVFSLYPEVDRVWHCSILQMIAQFLVAKKVNPKLANKKILKWSVLTDLVTTIISIAVNGASWLCLNQSHG
jgi:hypothetical protein